MDSSYDNLYTSIKITTVQINPLPAACQVAERWLEKPPRRPGSRGCTHSPPRKLDARLPQSVPPLLANGEDPGEAISG